MRLPSHRSKSSATGSIRIIGGRWRGRKLPVLNAEGLRPTTDRLKETLFNWLQFELQGKTVVDLFAGSGGLGFEALSRGAEFVHFAETQREAHTLLRSNVESLQANASVHADAEALLNQLPASSINILFLDPPFRKDLLADIFAKIEQQQLLAADAWIYVETGREEVPPAWPASWQLYREKTAGQVHARLFRLAHTTQPVADPDR